MALQRAWRIFFHINTAASVTSTPVSLLELQRVSPILPQHTPTHLYSSSGFMNSFVLSGTAWTGWTESILTQNSILLIGQRALLGGRT